jgi:hypothetical protein
MLAAVSSKASPAKIASVILLFFIPELLTHRLALFRNSKNLNLACPGVRAAHVTSALSTAGCTAGSSFYSNSRTP